MTGSTYCWVPAPFPRPNDGVSGQKDGFGIGLVASSVPLLSLTTGNGREILVPTGVAESLAVSLVQASTWLLANDELAAARDYLADDHGALSPGGLELASGRPAALWRLNEFMERMRLPEGLEFDLIGAWEEQPEPETQHVPWVSHTGPIDRISVGLRVARSCESGSPVATQLVSIWAHLRGSRARRFEESLRPADALALAKGILSVLSSGGFDVAASAILFRRCCDANRPIFRRFAMRALIGREGFDNVNPRYWLGPAGQMAFRSTPDSTQAADARTGADHFSPRGMRSVSTFRAALCSGQPTDRPIYWVPTRALVSPERGIGLAIAPGDDLRGHTLEVIHLPEPVLCISEFGDGGLHLPLATAQRLALSIAEAASWFFTAVETEQIQRYLRQPPMENGRHFFKVEAGAEADERRAREFRLATNFTGQRLDFRGIWSTRTDDIGLSVQFRLLHNLKRTAAEQSIRVTVRQESLTPRTLLLCPPDALAMADAILHVIGAASPEAGSAARQMLALTFLPDRSEVLPFTTELH